MASFTNNSKTAAFSPTNESENSATIYNHVKPGNGYNYDSYLTYDATTDAAGNTVYYDAIGTASSYTNESKS